ncbi:MAG: hypothetical protein IJW73_08725 [Candidatus Gastranaerophilales bacterium]|nr:hypothetical protein [Candidatus Gastranaerophilales bacterium]
MSNFTSNEYLTTTTESPYNYYWEQIDKSIAATSPNEERQKMLRKAFEDKIQGKANERNLNVKDKQMYAQLCFQACQAVLFEAVLTFGKPSFVAYALEYFVYAPTIFDLGKNPKKVNWDPMSYYNQLLRELENVLEGDLCSPILNNKFSSSTYNVLDVDTLRHNLRKAIDKFYANNPETKESTNNNPELQSKISAIFSNLNTEFKNHTSKNKHNNNWSF